MFPYYLHLNLTMVNIFVTGFVPEYKINKWICYVVSRTLLNVYDVVVEGKIGKWNSMKGSGNIVVGQYSISIIVG